jgi:hypothetical protein
VASGLGKARLDNLSDIKLSTPLAKLTNSK